MKSFSPARNPKKGSVSDVQPIQKKNGKGISLPDTREPFVSQLKNKPVSNGVIQRYAIVQPENLNANEGAIIETSELVRTDFGSEYVRRSSVVNETGAPGVTETTTQSGSGTQTTTQSTLPPFKVSQKGMMALPAVGQPRNLYTDPGRISKANEIISKNAGTVRLKEQGAGISVPRNPYNPEGSKKRELKKVHAAIEKKNEQTQQIKLEIQNVFPVMNCNDFIDQIIGTSIQGARLGILETKGKPETKKTIGAPEANEPVREIATHLSESGVKLKSHNPNSLSRKLGEVKLGSDELETGTDNYFDLSNTTKNARAEKYGINEFASPEVGEGLVIKTNPTSNFIDYTKQIKANPRLLRKDERNDKKTQQNIRSSYTQLLDDLDKLDQSIVKKSQDLSGRAINNLQGWGQHYAGVVAKDGSDYVTLENYNRNTEVDWEYGRIFNNLFRNFKQFREHVSRNVTSLEKTPDSFLIQDLVDLAFKAKNLKWDYHNALVEAYNSFQTGLKKNEETQKGNFYFQMYGPGKQSFHSAFKGSTFNPVTLRITEPVEPAKKAALDSCGDLSALIHRWETPVLANPLNVTAQTRLTKVINTARSEEAKARNQIKKGNTRRDYLEVNDAVNQLINDFADKMKTKVIGNYQHITGNAPNPVANNFTDLSARCTAFLNTYYWFNKADDAYKNITKLRTLSQALINANL